MEGVAEGGPLIWNTPPEIGRELRVKEERVRAWIESGQLTAVNVGDKGRPRYRVSRDALDSFLASRSGARPVTPKKPARRRTFHADGPY